MADFPLAIHSFTPVTNDEDVIDAAHMNTAHAELTAIETLLAQMKNIMEGWQYDRDHIEGLDMSWASSTTVSFSAGSICISGAIVFVSGASVVTLADVLRDGDSITNNSLHHLYAYHDSGSIAFELSNSGPASDLYHPDDKTRRWVSCISRISNAWVKYYQKRDAMFFPPQYIFDYGSTFDYYLEAFTKFAPSNLFEAQLYVYITGDANAKIEAEFTFDSTNCPGLVKFQDHHTATNAVWSATFWVPCTEPGTYMKATYGNYFGMYITGFRFWRKRY